MSASTESRAYELLLILDPTLDERTVAPSIDQFLTVVRNDGGDVENVDVWGKRRLAYEIDKNVEGIYVLANVQCSADTVKELDRQLNLNESVLRTKVTRPVGRTAKAAAAKAGSAKATAAKAGSATAPKGPAAPAAPATSAEK